MNKQPKGTLIIIGGHERSGDQEILEEIARRVRRHHDKHLVLMTVASHEPEALAEDYTAIFKKFGISKVDVLDVRMREDAHREENIEMFKGSPVVFFTGGDQLRIASQIGDSPVYQALTELYEQGGTIVGTSAGAAVMPETMLVSGLSEDSSEMAAIGMSPGLGLLKNVVIDTHFAERGRINRILAAVAQNPRNIGLGIDEDTAVIVKANKEFTVLGKGAVYVVDGTDLSYSSLSLERPEGVISIHGLKLHVIADGDAYDLEDRQPILSKEALEEIG